MELFDIISNDIKEAMKAKDKVALDTLRNIKKVLLEAKTAPGAGDTVSDATAVKLIQKLVKQGKESAELYSSQNRPELAQEELAQVAVMEKYLPKQMSEEEVKAVLAFHGFFKRSGQMEMIQNVRIEPIDMEEAAKRPSIVGYLVKDGDDLWTLAKRYSTTMNAIKEVNEVSGEQIKPGDRLLIFKENMSIL